MGYEIPYSKPYFPERTSLDVLETFNSSYISGFGEAIDVFEHQLKTELSNENCLVVSNGSAAIRLAFLTLGMKPGAKVVLPAWGFHVAANIAYSMGANLEFVDVAEDSWCLDLGLFNQLEGNLDEAILVLIHTLGNCSDLGLLNKNSRNYRVIEDAAEAIFSKYRGDFLGTIFDFGTFSFHAAKTITTGEGGLVAIKSTEDFNNAKLYRSHGMTTDQPYVHNVAGDNLRLSNLLAAVGIGQMAELDYICKARSIVYERYMKNLEDLDPACFLVPTDKTGFFPWGFGIRVKKDFGVNREDVVQALKAIGVETRPGFSSASSLPYIKEFSTKSFPVADALAKEVLLLPHYPDLALESVDRICDAILNILR
jgi:dTDP-4-amino-4,6-dideoxygalactose transaminase